MKWRETHIQRIKLFRYYNSYTNEVLKIHLFTDHDDDDVGNNGTGNEKMKRNLNVQVFKSFLLLPEMHRKEKRKVYIGPFSRDLVSIFYR